MLTMDMAVRHGCGTSKGGLLPLVMVHLLFEMGDDEAKVDEKEARLETEQGGLASGSLPVVVVANAVSPSSVDWPTIIDSCCFSAIKSFDAFLGGVAEEALSVRVFLKKALAKISSWASEQVTSLLSVSENGHMLVASVRGFDALDGCFEVFSFFAIQSELRAESVAAIVFGKGEKYREQEHWSNLNIHMNFFLLE